MTASVAACSGNLKSGEGDQVSNNSITPVPPVISTPTPSPLPNTSPYSIQSIINRGIQTDGMMHLSLNGNFQGSTDQVIATCSGKSQVAVSVLQDTLTEVSVGLAPLDGTCQFAIVNNIFGTNVATALSTPVHLSLTQLALVINQANDNGSSSSNASFEDISLLGSFNGQGDQVWASCDKGVFAQVTAGNVSLDSASEIDFSIPAPAEFNSCHFYVIGAGVQSSIFDVMMITNAADMGADQTISTDEDVVLTGTFVGTGDQVFASCDGGPFLAVPGAKISLDSATEIDFSFAQPQSFNSCQFYVSDGVRKSNVFSLLGVTSAQDNGTDDCFPDQDDIVLSGFFIGNGDAVYVSCDGAPMKQVPSTQIQSDTPSEIDLLIPTPNDFNTCQFTVQ
jgi:hypothetical protein